MSHIFTTFIFIFSFLFLSFSNILLVYHLVFVVVGAAFADAGCRCDYCRHTLGGACEKWPYTLPEFPILRNMKIIKNIK